MYDQSSSEILHKAIEKRTRERIQRIVMSGLSEQFSKFHFNTSRVYHKEPDNFPTYNISSLSGGRVTWLKENLKGTGGVRHSFYTKDGTEEFITMPVVFQEDLGCLCVGNMFIGTYDSREIPNLAGVYDLHLNHIGRPLGCVKGRDPVEIGNTNIGLYNKIHEIYSQMSKERTNL